MSGLKRSREMPVMRSTSITWCGGNRRQLQTPCGVMVPSLRARLTGPPAIWIALISISSRSAMPTLYTYGVLHVNSRLMA